MGYDVGQFKELYMKSFLVIGMGRFGSSVATELYLLKNEVLVVDKHEEKVTPLLNQVTNVIIGDTKDEAVLRSLGISNFDGVIIAIANAIEDSVLTAIMLKEMGAKMIVGKAQNEWHAKILTQIGVDKIIRPEFDIGKRLAHSLVQINIIDLLELKPYYSIVELHTPAHWINKSIANIDIKKKYEVILLAIYNLQTEQLNLSLSVETILHEGDILILWGKKHNFAKIDLL